MIDIIYQFLTVIIYSIIFENTCIDWTIDNWGSQQSNFDNNELTKAKKNLKYKMLSIKQFK